MKHSILCNHQIFIFTESKCVGKFHDNPNNTVSNTTIFIRQLGLYVQLHNMFKLITSSSDSQTTLKKQTEEDDVQLIASHS